MAAKIFKVLFKAILAIANVFLAPVNLAIVNLIPSVSDMINTFTQGVALLFTNSMSWFFYMIPPNTKVVIGIYLTFMLGYYTLSWALHGIVWLLKVIKKLPLT